MFLPSPELLEQFSLVPDGFTVNWLRGPFIGMRDAAEDVRKAKEEEERRAHSAEVVDGGMDSGTRGNPEANADAQANSESVSVAGSERPATGSLESAAELADSEGEAVSRGDVTAVSSAAGAGKKRRRNVSQGGAKAADAVVDLDAWSKEHREVLELCRIDIDELLSILRAPDCPLRLRISRKKPQIAFADADEPTQAST